MDSLRIVRTKMLLADALINLIQTAPLQQVSIRGICHEAMVHRTTFYKYFDDKQQLLLYYFDCALNDIVLNVEKDGQEDVIQRFFALCIDYVDDRRNVFTNLNNTNLEYLHIFFVELFKQKLELLLSDLLSANIDFFAGGIVATLVSWVQNSFKDSKQKMIDNFNQIVNKLDA